VLRRAPFLLLIALLALPAATAAAKEQRAPVLRKAAPVRQTLALNAASQWKTWWGGNTFDGTGVTLWSQAPVSLAETHSALVVTRKTWRDATISFRTINQKQLRLNDAPNTWECPWVMFRFKDLENYYWFMLKPNGFELGKKQGSDTQHFLVTGDQPNQAVGEWKRIRLVVQGARIQAFVDGTRIFDYTDPNPLLGLGSVGLYEEDAQVRFDSLAIS
jgi:hypothetical protein